MFATRGWLAAFPGLILLLLSTWPAFGQTTSLALASGSAARSTAVSLNLALSVPSGSAPAGLQWTIAYPTSDVTSISVTPGPPLAAAGKTLHCVPRSGAVTCLTSGMNANAIASGVAAMITVALSSSGTSSTIALPVSGLLAVSPDGSATPITGNGGAISVTTVATRVTALQCAPASIVSGANSTCTVTVSAAAPSGGLVVSASDNHAALTVPPSVTVAAGATTASFTATAGTVTATQVVTVSASLNGSSVTVSLTITPANLRVTGLVCLPTSISPFRSSTCTVALSSGAPNGGLRLSVTSNRQELYVPSLATVASASTLGNFSVLAGWFATPVTATVTVSMEGSSVSTSVTLTGRSTFSSESESAVETASADGISELRCSPGTAHAGTRVTCDLRVGPVGRIRQIELASSSERVRVPAAITMRADQANASFEAEVDAAAGKQAATVIAASEGSGAEATILVLPASAPVLRAPRRRLARAGERVSFSIGAVDPSGLPVTLAAEGLPAGASFDTSGGIFDWLPDATQAGRYEVRFTATDSAGRSSTAPVTLELDSGKPALDDQEFSCSPNSLASLTGRWLAGNSRAAASGSTRVRVNGQEVPVISSSDTGVRFVCPALEPGTRLSIEVATPSGSTEPLLATLTEVSPAIFSLDETGQGQGLVSFPDSDDVAMVRNFRTPAHPAQPGDEILIWATGLGAGAGSSTGAVAVRVGGVLAEVNAIDAAPARPGVYAIRARVPQNIVFGNAVPLQLEVTAPSGKQYRSGEVTIAVERNIQ